MNDFTSCVTRLMVPMSVTLSTLPLFQPETSQLLPLTTHQVPADEVPAYHWERYDSAYSLLGHTDTANYSTITEFASKLIAESHDIPPEFSRILVEDFWNLV